MDVCPYATGKPVEHRNMQNLRIIQCSQIGRFCVYQRIGT